MMAASANKIMKLFVTPLLFCLSVFLIHTKILSYSFLLFSYVCYNNKGHPIKAVKMKVIRLVKMYTDQLAQL